MYEQFDTGEEAEARAEALNRTNAGGQFFFEASKLSEGGWCVSDYFMHDGRKLESYRYSEIRSSEKWKGIASLVMYFSFFGVITSLLALGRYVAAEQRTSVWIGTASILLFGFSIASLVFEDESQRGLARIATCAFAAALLIGGITGS